MATPVATMGPREVVVVAPHPDDESLTVGGLIQRVVADGGRVTVVAVTDGGNAYPRHIAHDGLVPVRRREQTDAVRVLGVTRPIVRLGLVDGGVADHAAVVEDELRALVHADALVVAPWEHDVHTDHEAVGRCARRVCDEIGAERWGSLFWAWHRPTRPLVDLRLVRLDLTPSELAFKQQAIACHQSQLVAADVAPVLTSDLLEPARWPCEFFVRVPPSRPGPSL